MTNLVLWAGHFGIGLAYYLRFYFLQTKEETDKGISEALEKNPSPFAEDLERLMRNKMFVLALYLIVGYLNLFMHIKRIYKNLKKKENE